MVLRLWQPGPFNQHSVLIPLLLCPCTCDLFTIIQSFYLPVLRIMDICIIINIFLLQIAIPVPLWTPMRIHRVYMQECLWLIPMNRNAGVWDAVQFASIKSSPKHCTDLCIPQEGNTPPSNEYWDTWTRLIPINSTRRSVLFKDLFIVYVWVFSSHLCQWAMCAWYWKALDSLELELQMVVRHCVSTGRWT